ncbi:hypothetical protein AXF42_Ash018054 [Apostasia shenzhenica]|uniref:Uncharacterized protein n=1 Tax=Apostasia shenzhenica TaxID=1088818 RepID=A0A2I0AVL9_9ASPA|nr:hypothetical protein AXF42_Ash018054 [Apostasia shenzhenica]
MASISFRSLYRTSLSSLRSHISSTRTAGMRPPTPTSTVRCGSPTTAASGAASPRHTRRLGFSSSHRSPVELGGCSGSMYPMHSVVAAARLKSRLSLTSRSCRDLSQGTLCRTSPGL